MNMFKIMLVLLSVFAVQLGCATSDASVTSSQNVIPPQDDPVETVKKLWAAAAEGRTDTRDSLMSVSAPRGFYQTECVTEKSEANPKLGELNAAPSSKSWMYDATVKELNKVAPKKLTLDEAALERVRGDEAIVRIIYSDKPEHIFVESFCLLSRDAGGNWKVFLLTNDPVFDSAVHYAADRCQPAPKLSSNLEAHTR